MLIKLHFTKSLSKNALPKGKAKSIIISSSQNGKKDRSSSDGDDEEEEEEEVEEGQNEAGGKSQKDEITPQEKEKLVGSLVRFAILMDSTKSPIKREDINKHVMGNYTKRRGLANQIIQEAAAKLKSLFGFEMVDVTPKASSSSSSSSSTSNNNNNQQSSSQIAPASQLSSQLNISSSSQASTSGARRKRGTGAPKETSAKVWILRLAVPDQAASASEQQQQQAMEQRSEEVRSDRDAARVALLMILVTIITLEKHPVAEDQLWNYLRLVGIDRHRAGAAGAGLLADASAGAASASASLHPVFGNVEHLIDSFVKDMYISKKKDPNSALHNQSQQNHPMAADPYTSSSSAISISTGAAGRVPYVYTLGERSVQEIEKNHVYRFVSHVMGKQFKG